jgi:hypothetical protein
MINHSPFVLYLFSFSQNFAERKNDGPTMLNQIIYRSQLVANYIKVLKLEFCYLSIGLSLGVVHFLLIFDILCQKPYCLGRY